jgi:hypothetical protein
MARKFNEQVAILGAARGLVKIESASDLRHVRSAGELTEVVRKLRGSSESFVGRPKASRWICVGGFICRPPHVVLSGWKSRGVNIFRGGNEALENPGERRRPCLCTVRPFRWRLQ